MIPRICVSILPKTVTEAIELIDRAEEAKADLVEIRLDLMQKKENLDGLAKYGSLRKIATNKLTKHNGQFQGSEGEGKRILLRAAKDGFDYVDIDLSTTGLKKFVAEISQYGAKPIVSFHDFDHPLEIPELNTILEKEIEAGAEVCKIVTAANRQEDNLLLLNFAREACKKSNVVCFATGDCGKISRLLSPLFGCLFTFASLERGGETGSGQMTIEEMKTAYKILGLRR